MKRKDGKIVPLTTVIDHLEKNQAFVITQGQHDVHERLHGIGRRIRVWSEVGIDIWEGQWKRDELQGLGRWINFQWPGDFGIYIGGWDDSMMHS